MKHDNVPDKNGDINKGSDEDPFVSMSVGQNVVGALGTIFIVFVVLPVIVWLLMVVWDLIFG